MMSHLRGEPGSASLPSPASSPFSWTAGSRLWTGDREKGPFAQAMPVGSTSLPEHEAPCLEGRGEMDSVQHGRRAGPTRVREDGHVDSPGGLVRLGGLREIREGRDKAATASHAKKQSKHAEET